MEGKPITIAVDKQHAPLRLASNRSEVANETSSVSHRSTWGTVRAGSIVDERKAKLLDQVREAIRVRHYSLRTEEAYIHWIRRFIIVVREGKGNKDRLTMLPLSVKASLVAHLARVRELHQHDLAQGFGSVYLPDALHRKYPNAPKEWG